MIEIISFSQPIAKKEHICSYCGLKIDKWEKYLRYFLIYDYAYTWKSHYRCEKIVSALKMQEHHDNHIDAGTFITCINDEFLRLSKCNRMELPCFSEQLDYVCKHHLK
jgi:hypothetical protein